MVVVFVGNVDKFTFNFNIPPQAQFWKIVVAIFFHISPTYLLLTSKRNKAYGHFYFGPLKYCHGPFS